MPPQLAAFLTASFIVVLIRREKIMGRSLPGSCWIPLVWFMIISSRFPGQWISPGGAVDLVDGSPVDRAFFLFLMFLGLIVLSKRRLDWAKILKDNRWIFLFFLYCGISVIWSDFAFIGFKRWIKDVGNVIMVLVILTAGDPEKTVQSLCKYYMYILVPTSILFIKYYPHLGRRYDPWTGEVQHTGVGITKNYLGFICLISGLYLLWSFLLRKQKNFQASSLDMTILSGFAIMIFWLLIRANSATGIGTLLVACIVLLLIHVGITRKNIKKIGLVWTLVLAMFAFLQVTMDIFGVVVRALGRDATLTDRLPLWTDILSMKFNRLLGTGYDTFWLGWRLDFLWETRWWKPNQAHNGYLEIFINLGVVGLCLLLMVLFTAFKKNQVAYANGENFSLYGLAFIPAAMLYNITEATFKGLHPIWFVLILVSFHIYSRKENDPEHGLPEIRAVRSESKNRHISPHLVRAYSA